MVSTLDFTSYFSLEPELWAERGPLFARGGALQFGFESEFTELEPVLAFYEPLPETGLSPSAPGLASTLLALCRSLEHGDKRPLLVRKDGPDFLPATLFRDDTGNIELVLPPVTGLAEFWGQIQWINSYLGTGSLQAMVSLPRMSFFSESNGRDHLGWLNFFNELDVLERLVRGNARGPGPVLRTFLHPYLGPMIRLRHKLLAKFLRENSQGRMLEADDLIRPARRDQSFKFVGSTAYRPDVAAPSRICFEVRDAHRNPDLLRERVARILFYWRRSLGSFERYADIPPFDSAEAFSALPHEVQAWLERETPFRAPAAVLPFENPRFTYEVFRNFAYPLRNWSPWLELLGVEGGERVRNAQKIFVDELRASVSLSGEAAMAAAQSATARFGAMSGLHELFLAEERRLVEVLRG